MLSKYLGLIKGSNFNFSVLFFSDSEIDFYSPRYINSVLHVFLVPFIATFGIIGNIYAVVLLIRSWSQLRGHHVPLIFLGIGDVIALITNLGLDRFWTGGLSIYLNRVYEIPLNMNDSLCIFLRATWSVGLSVSANFLCLIAIDRVMALYKPFFHRLHFTKHRLFLFSIFSLLFMALVCIIPISLTFGINRYGPTTKSCYIRNSIPSGIGILVQIIINLFVNGLTSCIVLLVLNSLIAMKIRKISKASIKLSAGEKEAKTSEIKASITLVFLAGTYLLCTIPKIVFYVGAFLVATELVKTDDVSASRRAWLSLAHMCDLMYFTNCSLNWIIYVARFDFLRPKCCSKTENKYKETSSVHTSSNTVSK